MSERADAARNRQSILRAAEGLLTADRRERLSVDEVAAAAGVGKGTVFRRFGNRTGLFQELLAERSARIREAIDTGPPPLGPGAPPRDRLLAFLDELAELAARNTALFSAHEQACATGKHDDPTYRRWHEHVSGLVAAIRPDADAGFFAHILLGAFDGDLVRRTTADGGAAKHRAAVREVAEALLGAN